MFFIFHGTPDTSHSALVVVCCMANCNLELWPLYLYVWAAIFCLFCVHNQESEDSLKSKIFLRLMKYALEMNAAAAPCADRGLSSQYYCKPGLIIIEKGYEDYI